jgi:hypothetical protein
LRHFFPAVLKRFFAFEQPCRALNLPSPPSLPCLQFRINGTISHRLGPLLPAPGQPPKFAQIYILDEVAAAEQRHRIFGEALNRNTLLTLEAKLESNVRLMLAMWVQVH